MVKFTVDQVRMLMDHHPNIRNMSVIAHVDHGKSTLTDSLIAAAGIIAEQKAGDVRFTQARADEQERGITIKSTSVSLYFSFDYLEENLEIKTEAEKKDDRERAIEDAKNEEESTTLKVPESACADPTGAKDLVAREEVDAAASCDKLFDDGRHHFLINLIDSPGHVDFSSEVTAALRVTDGALVVIDCVEGVCVQTETVLRQAIAERIKPVVWVNKVDRLLLELSLPLEEAYQSFNKAIESVNVIIETYKDPLLGSVQVSPAKGTVGFGSGLQAWGFTVTSFARMYASKFGMDTTKMMEKMWGDQFFFAKTKKWRKQPLDRATGEVGVRGFVQYCLKPIASLVSTITDGDKDKMTALFKKLDIKLPQDAKDLVGKALVKRVMQTWLPAADSLLQMIVVHLPSPLMAQRYRVANLYNGNLSDPEAIGIRDCDPNAPLMMYVSKMVPTSDKGRFYAFGRVFSGTIKTNQTVNIMGPDYKEGEKLDYYPQKKIQRTVLMMGRYVEQIADCPCGNVCGLVGIDQFLLKAGTITTSDTAAPFHCMRFSVSPVVRVAVDVKNASDLPKLVEGLRRLAKSDPLVLVITQKSGEHIVAGAGELHLEICLKDLQEDFMRGAPIKISEPVVPFRETVSTESVMQCVSKSSNKHNRVYAVAEPLGEELCLAVDNGSIEVDTKDPKKRTKTLVENFNWEKDHASKIWTFGCAADGIPNCLVDTTKGISFLNEIKDSMCSAFQQMSLGGVFCDEPLRGIRVNLQDIVLHADAIHRGAGQMMPVTKKVVGACQIKSGPRLMEPMYICDITVPLDKVSGVYNTLQTRRGRVVPEAEEQITGNLTHVKAYLPVMESFGFTQKLRQNTSGKAFPQMIFDHWEIVGGSVDDPFDFKSKTYEIIMACRKRKGLKEELPDFNDYYDKV